MNDIERAQQCYFENGIGEYDENIYTVFNPFDELRGECIPIDQFILDLTHCPELMEIGNSFGYFAKAINDEIREYCAVIPDVNWIKNNRMDFDYIAWYNVKEEN